jgi:hypothetical protein
MKTKLSPTQETVLQIIARGNGRPRSFEGAQLRAAGAIINRELIERKGRSLGYTLTKAGEDYAREAGWLTAPEAKQPEPVEAAAVVAVRGEVSNTDVVEHLLNNKKRQTLKSAEQLLAEVNSFVERLRTGQIPTTCININSVGFLVADHAKLLTLTEVLEGIGGTEKG